MNSKNDGSSIINRSFLVAVLAVFFTLGIAYAATNSGDLSLTKTVDDATPSVSETVNYTLTVSALGPATSTGVVATDTLPSGLIFENATASVGTYASSTGTWTIGDLSASSTATLLIAAQIASGTASSTITNTAIVGEDATTTDPDLANNTASVSIVVQQTMLSALVDLGGIEDLPGNNPTENNGDFNDLVFSFSPSSTVTAVSQNGSLSPLTANLVNDSGTIYWDNPSLDGPQENIGYCVLNIGNCPSIGGPFSNPQYLAGPSGTQINDVVFNTSGSVTITLLAKDADYNMVESLGWYDPANPSVLHPIFSGSAASGVSMTFTPTPTFGLYLSNGHGGTFFSQNAQNIGDVDKQHFALFDVGAALPSTPGGGSTSGGGGSGSTSSSTDADISVVKTVDNANPVAGATVNYTITVTANGPATSTIVSAQDLLPTGLSLVSATTSVGVYNMSSGDWTIGTLSPNATATLLIAAAVNGNEAGATITNAATVTELSSLVDPNSSNNSSSVSIVVQPTPCTSNCGGGGGGGGGSDVPSGVSVGVSSGGGDGGGGGSASAAVVAGGGSASIISIVPSLPNAGVSPSIVPGFPNTGFPPEKK